MNNYFYIIPKDPDLQHHGVLGQKWGVRRYQNKDGSLTKAGREHYNRKAKEYGSTATVCLFLLAASPLLLTLAAGGKEALDGLSETLAIKKGEKIDKAIAENPLIDKKTGLKLKQKEMTKDEDMAMVNPRFKDSNIGSKVNCAICSTCYDLRRRGFDVTANLRNQGHGVTDEQILKIYPKAKIEHILGPKVIDPYNKDTLKPKEIREQLQKVIKEQGNGARGQVLVRFPRKSGYGFGGHSMAYDIEDGKFVIRDCQENKKYTNPESILKKMTTVDIIRVDNTEPNYKVAKECVKGNEWVDLAKLRQGQSNSKNS